MIKRKLCRPCMEQLKATHEIRRISGKDEKIDCWRCKRRRFGASYEIQRRDKAE